MCRYAVCVCVCVCFFLFDAFFTWLELVAMATSIQHTAYNTRQHTAYNTRHTTHDIQHTAYNIQHTAYNTRHTTRCGVRLSSWLEHTAARQLDAHVARQQQWRGCAHSLGITRALVRVDACVLERMCDARVCMACATQVPSAAQPDSTDARLHHSAHIA